MKLSPSSTSDKKIKIQVYVPPTHYEKLEKESASYVITISELVRTIVRDHYSEDMVVPSA